MDACASPCASLDPWVAAAAALFSGVLAAATAPAGAVSAPHGLPTLQREKQAAAFAAASPVGAMLWSAFLLNAGAVAGSQWALLARPDLLSVPMRSASATLDLADGPLFAILRLTAGPVTHHVRLDKALDAASPSFALATDTSISRLDADTEFALWLSGSASASQRLLLSDGNSFRHVPFAGASHLERNAHPLVDCVALGGLGVAIGHAAAVAAPLPGTMELRLARSLAMDDEKGLAEVGAALDSLRPLQHAAISIFPALDVVPPRTGATTEAGDAPEVVLAASASGLLNPVRVYAANAFAAERASFAAQVRFARDAVPAHLEVTVVEPAGPDSLRLTLRNRSPTEPLDLAPSALFARSSLRALVGWAPETLLRDDALDDLAPGLVPRDRLRDPASDPVHLRPHQLRAVRLVLASSPREPA